jgi:hypothetical protein
LGKYLILEDFIVLTFRVIGTLEPTEMANSSSSILHSKQCIRAHIHHLILWTIRIDMLALPTKCTFSFVAPLPGTLTRDSYSYNASCASLCVVSRTIEFNETVQSSIKICWENLPRSELHSSISLLL